RFAVAAIIPSELTGSFNLLPRRPCRCGVCPLGTAHGNRATLLRMVTPLYPWYITAMVTDALLDSFPVSRYDTSVAEVLKEIGQYQKLQADWDAEGALPVSQEAAWLAAWLVQVVALSAKHQGISWQPPVV